jgi:nitrite reductase/ring-hydroxylating ferredoxin subunit
MAEPRQWTRVGSLDELRAAGRLVGKVDGRPVLVVWHEETAHAIDDRCPHLGFPLHQGSVEAGLVTCLWHHARFDLSSGCTLDPWADDADGYDVRLATDDDPRGGDPRGSDPGGRDPGGGGPGGARGTGTGDDGLSRSSGDPTDGGRHVLVAARPVPDRSAHLFRRLRQGLEDGLTLVIAKATLGLLDGGTEPADIVGVGLRFGAAQRAAGWGAGLTVLQAMANVTAHLAPSERGLALVHGLAFVARDVAGEPPAFPAAELEASTASSERLAEWYRRFVNSRSAEGARRALATLLVRGDLATAEAVMFVTATDHVFLDGGHTLDFTNKAFEAVAMTGGEGDAARLLPTLVTQTASAGRAEESLEWRHPVDLRALAHRAEESLPDALRRGAAARAAAAAGQVEAEAEVGLGRLGFELLGDEPERVVGGLLEALEAGTTPEQAARAVAYAAALRLARFHTQNDHGDWNEVHHAFTTANAVHQAIRRRPTPELARGIVHGALRVHLDRFLNIPAARLPTTTDGDLAELEGCWDRQGDVDRAGAITHGALHAGTDPGVVVAALGRALLAEDAGFHWYQVFEAAVRQQAAWPIGSEEQRLILVGLARFLAAHTPTRRELPRVVQIARRLRRGEAVHEENGR